MRAAGSHMPRRQGAVFEDVLFEMRVGRLKLGVEEKNKAVALRQVRV